ncbi:hypothetical protein [Microbacterium thalassium]|uniref:Uncharacterized protein n=1 Tax=Microbacterium thalassium TaxID=362649 RepID=A0A7X0KTE0_9MICO|nr:hypothetical protein [Microbacterium thalassium]MBB6390004.1 hypothetical protein [Microbacterium thalassium]GLK24690.1 hypothetical protein GCM10017607_20080 [Microbacterium thalassium]
MNELERPDVAAPLAEVARWIRQARPIEGAATDEDCRVRGTLIGEALAEREVAQGESCWYTAQLATGHVVGQWATSLEEAELSLSVWWGTGCHWVIPDGDLRVREEYFPNGVRTAAAATRAFPLGPPRRPRDRFAPAESLLAAFETTDRGRSLA